MTDRNLATTLCFIFSCIAFANGIGFARLDDGSPFCSASIFSFINLTICIVLALVYLRRRDKEDADDDDDDDDEDDDEGDTIHPSDPPLQRRARSHVEGIAR